MGSSQGLKFSLRASQGSRIAIYNDYQFEFNGGQDAFTFKLFSGVKDYSGKIDFDYFPNPNHSIKVGINSTYHVLTPNTASASSGEVEFKTDQNPKYALENAIYAKDEWKISKRFSIDYGMRFSIFTQVGPYTSTIDGKVYNTFDPVITYTGWEPRFSSKFSIDENQSIKLGITKTNQYIHLVSNSSSTLPTDVWSPSTERVKPQIGLQ